MEQQQPDEVETQQAKSIHVVTREGIQGNQGDISNIYILPDTSNFTGISEMPD